MSLAHWLRALLGGRPGCIGADRPKLNPARRQRLILERLEDRLSPAVLLSYNGPGTTLSLTASTGGPDQVTISEPTPGQLRIDLNGGLFNAMSVPTATGLTYSAGVPAASSSATVDISQPDNVSTLSLVLSVNNETVDLGMTNAAGGVGAVAVFAESAGDAVTLNSLTLGKAGTAGTLNVNADALSVAADSTIRTTGAVTLNSTGAGKLTVGSGAVVTSTAPGIAAVTLQGADLDLQGAVHAQGSLGAAGTFGAFASGLSTAVGMAFDATGNLYVANFNSNSISKVTSAGVVSPFASLPSGSGPEGLAFDATGNLYVANFYSNTVSKISTTGVVAPFASLPSGSGPEALAFDAAGNLYVADSSSNTVSKITSAGAVSAFVALPANSGPDALAFDAAGNLYVANDTGTISKVTPGGAVSTLTTGLNSPTALAIDAADNLYVASYYGGTLSEVTPVGAVSVFASGLNRPDALAFDAAGNLYVANYGAGTVGKVGVTNGGVTVQSKKPSPSQPSRPMSIGGADNAVAGINLTLAELANITTTGPAGLTFGDPSQTGTITFTITGPGAHTLSLGPGGGALTGGASPVLFVNASGTIVVYGGSTDTAYLSGSGTFTALPGTAYFSGSGFFNEAVGFPTVVGTAASATGLAVLFTSSGNDSFTGAAGASTLSGAGYTSKAFGFPFVVANAVGGGSDTATLSDAPGTNLFVGTATQGYLYGTGYFNEANNFKSVVARAVAVNAVDTASLFEGTGANTFVSMPALMGAPAYAYLTGNGFINEVVGLWATAAYTYAYLGVKNVATESAYLYGSGGADHFNGSYLTSSLAAAGAVNTVVGFQSVTASDSGRPSAAYLYDSPGNDVFTGQGAAASLTGPDYSISLTGFYAVAATSQAGGVDHEYILGSLDYLFTSTGNWH